MCEKSVSRSFKPQSSSTDALIDQRSVRPNLAAIGRLLRIWGSATLVSFLAIIVVYTLFFGRNKVVLNETIYENHRFVGQPGTFQISTSEGYGITSYGEDGLIVNKTLDPTVFRVLFMGDSFVKAKHVPDHEKFTEIVERAWNATHPAGPIQTLNLGLGGQSMSTYLSFGDNMDRRFHPDLVFVLINRNDFRTLAKDPRKLELVAQGLTKPLTEPETSTAPQDFVNWLGFRSFFGQLQAQTYGFLSSGSRADEAEPVQENSPLMNTEQEKSPLTNTEAVAIQLKALREIWGDRLVIIYRVSLPHMGRDAPATYEDDVLREVERQGIPIISLYQPFWQAFQERTPPTGFNNSILGEGHFNRYGHQLVAEEIIQFMETADDLF